MDLSEFQLQSLVDELAGRVACLSFQQWLIGASFLVLTALMTVYQFLS